jgi:SAM-dependent methyltransferase
MDTQLRTFMEGEGDRYFERNRPVYAQADPATDPPLRLIESYGLHPKAVLEVGCSNGYRLAAVARIHGAQVTGVEPSLAAIADGRERFPEVRFERGSADAIPLDERFDLVIVNFVFHWVDRSLLLRTAAEVDRVVEDGGFLIVGDYLPAHPTRRHYHHLPGRDIYTYKQDYAEIFAASSCYQRIAVLAGRHSQPPILSAVVDDDDRRGTTLLRKRLQELYVEPAG